LIAAFLCALLVASSPRLHEKLHQVGSHHECAATILAAGNCEDAATPQTAPQIQNAPTAPAFLPLHLQCVVAAIVSSVLEHAPPAGE